MDRKKVSIVLFKAGGRIMGFFEKLTSTINSTGKEVEQKAKMVSGTVKLNSQIKEINEAIQGYFKQVGELYYKKQGGVSEDEEIEMVFEKIRKGREDIQAAEREIELLKGIYRCKNCGAEMRITDNFCMMCGTKKEDSSQMLEQATVDSEAIVTDIEEKEPQELDFGKNDIEQEEKNTEEVLKEEEEWDLDEEWEDESDRTEEISDDDTIAEAAAEAEKSSEETKQAEEISEEAEEEEGEGIDPADFEDATETTEKKFGEEE